MSELPNKSDANIDALLQTQKGLIEAHIALIKMQQQLYGSAQLPTFTELRALKTALQSSKEGPESFAIGAPSPIKDSATGNLSESQEPNDGIPSPKIESKIMGLDSSAPVAADEAEANIGNYGSGSFYESIRNNAVFIGVFVSLTVFIVLIALISHPQSEDMKRLREQTGETQKRYMRELEDQSVALLNNQTELVNTQNSLKSTETKLAEVQQALRESQRTLNHSNEPRIFSAAIASPPLVETKPLNAEQRLIQAQQELLNIRVALTTNQRALIINLREYRSTAKTLALNRQNIFKIELEIRHAKGEISNEELTTQNKPLEEFLPPNARSLLNDPRLDDETPSALAVVRKTQDSHNSKDDVPKTLPEVQALLVKNGAELTTVMKQLTNIQSDIMQSQSDLTIALDELAEKSKELLALQNAPTKLKGTSSG